MNEILSSIRWGWAIVGAVVAQAVLIPVIYVMGAFTSGWGWTRADVILTPTAHLLVPFLAGVWVARKAQAHFTANGVAVGVITALIFLPVLIAIQPPYPLMEAVNEGLKIVGAAMGGGLVGHRARRRIRRRGRS